MERAAAGMEVATLTSDEICKRDGDRLERLRSSPKSDEASRFANDFGCEKLRTQPSALMQNLARAPSAQVVAHPKPPVEVGSAPAHVPSAPAGAHPRPFVELGSLGASLRTGGYAAGIVVRGAPDQAGANDIGELRPVRLFDLIG